MTAEALAGRPEEIGLLAVYPHVDELPGDLLDILAYDFKVDWYDYEYPLPAKRSLIRGNILAHKRQGTVYATKSVLRSLYPKSEMEEWFEYGGEPGHFWLFVNVSNSAAEDATPVYSAAETLRRLATVKRLSAHLDSMVYQCSVGVRILTGSDKYRHLTGYTGRRLAGTRP